jgi:hypothetical protein
VQGLEEDHEVAVIVQQFIRVEFAGVLFTADPITGNLMQMRALRYIELWWGRVPPDITVPLLPLPLRQALTQILPDFLRSARCMAKYHSQRPGFVAETPQWYREMRQRIGQADSPAELITL